MWWMIVLDVFVILLLGVGILYAWRLERMLRGLDNNRRDMMKFIADFSSSISRAERGVRELQDTAEDTGVEVDRQVARATALRDELTYLIDTADKIANRLTDTSREALFNQSEPMLSITPETPPPVVEEKPVAKKTLEEPLVPPWAKRAGQGQVVVNPKGVVRKNESAPAQKATAALQAVAEKETPRQNLRSEMERELQKAFEKAS